MLDPNNILIIMWLLTREFPSFWISGFPGVTYLWLHYKLTSPKKTIQAERQAANIYQMFIKILLFTNHCIGYWKIKKHGDYKLGGKAQLSYTLNQFETLYLSAKMSTTWSALNICWFYLSYIKCEILGFD